MDFLHIFVSNSAVAGLNPDDIRFPGDITATITHVQRGDTEMMISPGLVLEIGDRVGLLTNRRILQSPS